MDNTFSHILQRKGILKNFSIAKVVPMKKIEEIKAQIKSKTSSEEEFKKEFTNEMTRLGNMHSQSDPIPGIIYDKGNKSNAIIQLSKEHIKKLKSMNYTKSELCFYIWVTIKSLGLEKGDFQNVDPEEFGAPPDKDGGGGI